MDSQDGGQTHIFASDLLLAELDLDQRTHSGKELPPGPVFHTPVLCDVLLDTTDRQVLDLFSKTSERAEKKEESDRVRKKGERVVFVGGSAVHELTRIFFW